MGDIYIETDENFRVTKIHRMPFDPNNGMGYTREELEKKGHFVDEIPEPVHQVGRRSVAYYNPDINGIYYESIGIPLSDKERADNLENAFNALLDIMYSQNNVSTLELDSEEDSTDAIVSTDDDIIGVYIATQIISGKMDLDECLRKYPQCEEAIKDTLMQNGIQV